MRRRRFRVESFCDSDHGPTHQSTAFCVLISVLRTVVPVVGVCSKSPFAARLCRGAVCTVAARTRSIVKVGVRPRRARACAFRNQPFSPRPCPSEGTAMTISDHDHIDLFQLLGKQGGAGIASRHRRGHRTTRAECLRPPPSFKTPPQVEPLAVRGGGWDAS